MPRAKIARDPKPCPACGDDFVPTRSAQKYCSIPCVAAIARANRLEKSKSHTRRKHLNLWEVKLPDGRWISEQRYWYQKYWGVTLSDTHYVIFLNKNREDFSRENLALRNKELDHLVKTTGKLPKGATTRRAIPVRSNR